MKVVGDIFYVYVHLRHDTGKVFYVGKGHGRRASTKWSRGRWWNRIASKTTWNHEICQDGMSEDNAYLLEMWLIAKFRHEGIELCNISDGGEGKRSPVPRLRKPVNCSNGVRYSMITEASEATGIDRESIGAAARGKYKQAGGYTWWFDGDGPKDYSSPKSRMAAAQMKVVLRSDGIIFPSLVSAAKSVSGSIGNISIAARDGSLIRYGYTWSYIKNDFTELG